ncbi:pyrroloquinoline quinone biosynthesis peptide chaperone PqqD [candidate division CSSED10-310 bacterium]|uniref:Pyrroloquinoline quinone biosynthesis peptide chaperone PqqD n=1 Tax=candidate division CSSED10-310 bacterium TaxID=2855610 RepID=A0ABV6YU91_UNCC1
MLKSESIPKQVSGIKIETFGDGVLLYKETVREAAYLNNSAAVIWALCDGKNTLADIENALQKAYPEGKDSIQEDINFTLEKLQQKDAIEFK